MNCIKPKYGIQILFLMFFIKLENGLIMRPELNNDITYNILYVFIILVFVIITVYNIQLEIGK